MLIGARIKFLAYDRWNVLLDYLAGGALFGAAICPESRITGD
jgi:hypothetical protein